MHRYIPRLNCATGMLLIPCAAGACDAGVFFTPVVMQVLLGLSLFAAGIYRHKKSALSPAPTKAKGKSANTETAGTGRYGDYTTAPRQIRGGI